MATDTGKLMKFGDQFDDFDGETINATWEMNFYDFEVPYLRKTMRKIWVLLQPQAKASATIGYISNKNENPVKKRIEYSLVFFDDVDFGDKDPNFLSIFSQEMSPQTVANYYMENDGNMDDNNYSKPNLGDDKYVESIYRRSANS